MNKIEQQIVTASLFGTNTFIKGIAPAPFRDGELMAIIKGRFCAETPKGKACTTAILKAWLRAWHLANLYLIIIDLRVSFHSDDCHTSKLNRELWALAETMMERQH